MRPIQNNVAGLIFAALGTYFLYLDMTTPMTMTCGGMHHGNTLLGVGEMTWMWYTMALVHFFMHDCLCAKCRKVK